MKFEGRIVQLIFLISIALVLYLTGPWIIDTLGEIFKNYGGGLLNVEQF
jgi:hypothetical protein